MCALLFAACVVEVGNMCGYLLSLPFPVYGQQRRIISRRTHVSKSTGKFN